MAVFNGSVADIETKKNKVNSISSTPSDENYPSEKAVKDYVDNNSSGGTGGGISEGRVQEIVDDAVYECEKYANKVETMGDAPDKNVAYPTVSAVEAYVEEQIGDIEAALDNIIAIQNSLMGGDAE